MAARSDQGGGQGRRGPHDDGRRSRHDPGIASDPAWCRQPGPVTAEDLIAWCCERMAGFKVPRFVKFLAELPLNATGKVMKDQLR